MTARPTGPAGTPPVPLRSSGPRTGRWEHVVTRSYGTTIHRVHGDRSYYVKSTTTADRDDPRFHPRNEADRLIWLAGQGFPVPAVVEVGADGELSWLVTTAMDGVPAHDVWLRARQSTVLDVVTDLAVALHDLDPSGCPFDRTLAVTLPQARLAVQEATVDLDDLDEHHRGWSAQDLLAELDRTPVPAEEDVVVCHGDLCLDNVLVDPETLSVAGILDAGRLGRADRWLDLAIMLREIGDVRPGDDVARFLRRYGLSEVDEQKYHFYRLMDEFV